MNKRLSRSQNMCSLNTHNGFVGIVNIPTKPTKVILLIALNCAHHTECIQPSVNLDGYSFSLGYREGHL